MLLGGVVDRERWWMRISKGNNEGQVKVLCSVVGEYGHLMELQVRVLYFVVRENGHVKVVVWRG